MIKGLEVSAASGHSVNNAKLSFMRIYFFICQCCTKTIGAVAIVTNSIYHYLSLFADNKYEYKRITY